LVQLFYPTVTKYFYIRPIDSYEDKVYSRKHGSEATRNHFLEDVTNLVGEA
jgi:hypothetical protein